MNFELDTAAAKRADKENTSISTSGYYEGIITQCYLKASGSSSATAVAFSFKTDDGLTANFDLWIQGKDGKFNFFYDIFNAGLACLKLRAALAKIGKAKVWDNGAEAEKDMSIYPDICNKKIGVILQKEEYLNQDGKKSFKMNLKHFINAETKQTGGEILAQLPPEKFAKLENKYTDILLDVASTQKNSGHLNVEITDDEIPF